MTTIITQDWDQLTSRLKEHDTGHVRVEFQLNGQDFTINNMAAILYGSFLIQRIDLEREPDTWGLVERHGIGRCAIALSLVGTVVTDELFETWPEDFDEIGDLLDHGFTVDLLDHDPWEAEALTQLGATC